MTQNKEFQRTLTFSGKSNFSFNRCNKEIRRKGMENEIENDSYLVSLVEAKSNYQEKSNINLTARNICLSPLKKYGNITEKVKPSYVQTLAGCKCN